MIIISRKQCTYYIKDTSIILEYNNQFISYNTYLLQNRKKFKDFKNILLESEQGEYDNINDIVALAREYSLVGMAAHKPVITDEDLFIR